MKKKLAIIGGILLAVVVLSAWAIPALAANPPTSTTTAAPNVQKAVKARILVRLLVVQDAAKVDALCGTKALTRADYRQIAAHRGYFGDFDPFGDFDLLFGADKLNLKIADIPIRYQDRAYGQTNIQRWRHGWLLLRMVVFAARKLRFT